LHFVIIHRSFANMDIDSDTELELALPELGPESPVKSDNVAQPAVEAEIDAAEAKQDKGWLRACC
jgi:hypothetical protein